MKAQLETIAKIKLKKSEGKLYYSGSLDLEGTQITALPENLTVGGSLDLRGTQITALPENLTVGGYLLSKLIGSREAITSYHIKHDVIHCGCFKGTIDEFTNKVHSVYSSGIYRTQYDEFIELAKNWRNIYLSQK